MIFYRIGTRFRLQTTGYEPATFFFQRSVSPLLLRSLATSSGSDDEDDDEEVTPAPAAAASGPLCQLDCSEERVRPVCGTDGATYPSRCHLQQAICQGNNVRLDYRGECSDSKF